LIDFAGSTKNVFEYLQGGYVDVGFVSGDEVDRYGNVNGWVTGSIKKPQNVFEGGGLACDVVNLANSTFIMATSEQLRKCSFFSAPGYLKGGKSRLKEGLYNDGPVYIICELCVFDFHPKSKKARVLGLFPDVKKSEVADKIGWRAKWPWKVPVIYPPTEEELEALEKATSYIS
jgi:glutaconate CoA-transferase, subunit B